MARKEPELAERLKTASEAKLALLEKMRTNATANAAQIAQRHAAQAEIDKAREIRTADRKAVARAASQQKQAEIAAKAAARAKAIADEKARIEAELAAKLAAEEALKKEQKALRDAKYASRKGRK